MAAVVDLCTRMVVGLSFSERMDASLPIAALEGAWRRGYVAEGAVFHSDRGSQYTSKAMAEWAAAHAVRLSVGRTGSCLDNAVAESFFGTFKNEMYHLRPFATRDEARVASVGYVEGYYNPPAAPTRRSATSSRRRKWRRSSGGWTRWPSERRRRRSPPD